MAHFGSPDGLMPLHEGILYGPLRSRRLGWSLGVNLLPASRKVCTFNCIYCQYGWTESRRRSDVRPYDWPSVETIRRAVVERLGMLDAAALPVDRLTLAGHGEPTLHPRFAEIVEVLRDVRDRVSPRTRLSILSNSTTAHDASVREALERLDERFMKLDAGDAETLRRINIARVSFDRLVSGLASIHDLTIQTMFVRDERAKLDNTTPRAVGNWLQALARIRPREAHLYSLARHPALPRLRPVPSEALDAIAEQVRAIGIPTCVF